MDFYNVFTPSRATSNVVNLLKTIFQIIIFWVFFLYVIPRGIVWFQLYFAIMTFDGFEIIGWIMFFCCSFLGLYSGWTMSWVGKGTPLPLDCPNILVTKGPYKYLRNPMAVAGIGQGISVGIITGSWLVIIYAISGAFLWHYFVRPAEEDDLETRFGYHFKEYKERVGLWWPKQLNFFR
ncbi:MAG: isoprenylcysteine carboxylmethyltransferase family protein [Saprospiraceae bacterium]|jgi:protein-S-isoprenylcysteine O-methyltransferase Ste14|nr:isoprenylcysteine carboxylmethyltransferase family protein [Saprospiraceae bacterium]